MSPLAWLCCAIAIAATPPAPFAIEVVDAATGRGVPLVELRTVDNLLFVTDSAGLAAIDDAALANQTVFFHLRSHGYEFPADGFGFRGKAIKVAPGETVTLRIKRVNVAERLYRVTGAGIYRDSVLLGRAAPIARPLLNSQVAGSDSVNTAVFGGRVVWFWGDTNRLGYPLGCFHVPGATSRLPAEGGLPIDRGVDLNYFTRDDGFVADTCRMPGDGPTWIDGLCVIRDGQRERMFAKYVKVRKFLEVYERGLVEWNDAQEHFDKVATFDFQAPLYPHGHSLAHREQGTNYIYFGNPFPLVRARAEAAALTNPEQYEAYTCLEQGSSLEQPKVARDEHGRAHWSWQRNTPAPSPRDQSNWLAKKVLAKGESLCALRDVASGEPVVAHAGSVAYNPFRRRFVMIAEQSGGSSALGEIWYAEADTPLGPWVYAHKIVTHDKYSFYNPRHHPMFDQRDGRRIFFEGTYSTFFSGNDAPTPRYDYNQVMYALDLEDARAALPVAVYESQQDGRQVLATLSMRTACLSDRIAWMALDRTTPESVAVVRRGAELVVQAKEPGSGPPVEPAIFYALPADAKLPPKTSLGLFAWKHSASGATRYAVADASPGQGYVRGELPLCLVWRYPLEPGIRFGE